MVDYREILRPNNLGYTKKDIASSVHSSSCLLRKDMLFLKSLKKGSKIRRVP